MDFMLDVFSCCPEDMRSPRQEEAIRQDEEKSRLMAEFYGADLPDDTFALLLWNDEKHSVDEVAEQVAKACQKTRRYGRQKAGEVDQIGRSLINKSTDVKALLKQARILAQIKVTVTIRSSRDIFREEMCHTIVQWLADIAGCSVAGDNDILMNTVCQELLRPWRQGSPAFNMQIARNGIVDHQRSDARLENMRRRLLEGQAAARFARMQAQLAATAQRRTAAQTGVVAAVQPAPAGPTLVIRRVDNDEQIADVTDENQMDIDDDAEVEMMEGEFVIAEDDELIDVFTAANEGPRLADVQESEDEEMDLPPGVPSVPAAPEIPQPRPAPAPPVEAATPSAPLEVAQPSSNQLIVGIPQTPRKVQPSKAGTVPSYWLEVPTQSRPPQDFALHERMDQRVRLDNLILYDLRMWKTLRYSLSHLYISTVVTVPSFKRTLGLRFATLYTPLAQLYLVADREPEHSIIHLSLQMLTTPTITAEIVERSNFLTRLIAILYTFLTKRQVGNPEDVDTSVPMSFESGVMSNRRFFHFFQDMRYLLDSPYVQDRICHEPRYLLQFLDFARLSQGICANTRAVGDHVEYESETWYAAGNIVRDITRLSRQFCQSFVWHQSEDASNICRALRQTAKIAIINSLGVGYEKFPHAEHRGRMKFKAIVSYDIGLDELHRPYMRNVIPDFKVAESTMSFHHPLHYTLSWLINSGKSMSSEQLKNLLAFRPDQLEESVVTSGSDYMDPHGYMMALFDIPLRVCAWMAQMRAGMWVRNGMSLRHQMHFYRGITHRDLAHRRDLYLLQVAVVVCEPTTFLASVLDRYSVDDWVRGEYVVKPGFDDFDKMVDMVEEMLHLLIVLLTDRILLRAPEEDPDSSANLAMQELIQTLCFKPLTFSELSSRLSDKVTEHEAFPSQLDQLTIYKAPEGLSDSGTFSLKEEFIDLVDPYSIYFNRGQREDCEKIWREYTAKRSNIPVDQLVYRPRLQNIGAGLFKDLTSFTKTPVFVRISVSILEFLMRHERITGGKLDHSRLEGLLNSMLHLILITVLDDKGKTTTTFTDLALRYHFVMNNSGTQVTLMDQLLKFIETTGIEFQASRHRVVAVIREMERIQPELVREFTSQLDPMWLQTYLGGDDKSEEKAALKKKQAAERQAKVMAAFKKQQNDFLQNQTIDWGLDEEDIGEDDNMMAGVDEVKTWPWPQDTCILCQEDVKEHELYGTLGYLAESNIFRVTDLENTEYVHEVLAVPTSLNRSADAIRPFGVAGQNQEYTTKVSKDGDTIAEERRSLGTGYPLEQHQSGPVASGCGHVMHFSCFLTYEASTVRRHSYQITRNHPEDTTKSEFTCPICKALGNTFLPIIWKPKPCVTPPERDDESFLTFVRDTTTRGVFEHIQLHRPRVSDYADRTFVSSLASNYLHYPDPPRRQSIDDSQEMSSVFGRSFGRWRSAPLDAAPASAATSSTPVPATDFRPLNCKTLTKAYQRILQSMSANNLLSFKVSDTSQSELLGLETIVKSLGYSIASVEIAQRGVGEDDNYIQSIPETVINNLRIWSETVSSYFMLSTLTSPDARGAKSGNEMVMLQANLLIPPPGVGLNIHSLFCQDIFVFLAECSICIVPMLEIDFGNILRMCYFAEIVKIVVATLTHSTKADLAFLWTANEQIRTEQQDYANTERFSTFVQHIIGLSAPFTNYPEWIHNPNERSKFDLIIRSMVTRYMLQFLRQAALLVHVRYGVDFSTDDNELDAQPQSELHRLTMQLGLPVIDEMVHITLSSTLTGHLLQRSMDHWINAYSIDSRKPDIDPRRWKPYDSSLSHHQTPSFLLPPPTLALSHPGIYELIALPETHDTLNAVAMTRRCPTTSGPLDDPSLCLFCGTFVCTQSRCCHRFNKAKRQEEGGCFLHREQCGGNIGLYLNVRKCAVLMLHNGNGSWFAAPYLDRYGETDIGLRRKEQLFLNQKRYERLYREMWLRQGVPTTVARKLESEVNSGGWEVM